MRFSYHNPVRIEFGVELLDWCQKIESEAILLVTSSGFSKRGLTEKIQKILGSKMVAVVDSILPNPELTDLLRLKSDLGDFTSILAIGGGSVLDSAKFLSVCGDIVASNGKLEIKTTPTSSISRPIFAFPTTAGTGSELTKWATIWDSHNMIKYSLQDENLYPHTALYDVNLTRSLSKENTISTGLDSLSHACESLWNKNANPISTQYAIDSIKLIVCTLPKLIKDLDSITLRSDMMRASMYAALAFSNTQTALAHAISYPLTMRFGIPHGLACSFSIPLLLDCLPSGEIREILNPLTKEIKGLFSTIQVSTNARDYGVDSVMLEEIFNALNDRAKNGVFDLEVVKQRFLHTL